ncbi:peptidyl-alpha-hydroxyglycine alpha-amidating lyase 1-like isoform X2 [Cimex lectularius]|nr:peptidyl-alpha-hydroxyglycine alpha-amidating lyase 1-like isoform X2 [Cimex lectularius]XP_014246229.1 peptidyl-alpha-hydroxyglycine alpha-amidating lyase 1-like isoform X2 [Cimex lectularius]
MTYPLTKNDYKFGQISGVAVDALDNIYIFHRAGRIWNANSFDIENNFLQPQEGPIKENTILVFDKNGTLLNEWGSGIFFLPHGITVDAEFNVWVTDVALHQIMKLSPQSKSAVLVLGVRLTPGRDSSHFCKPTSVAVTANGDFFVADGYCNSRIMKFNSKGVKILEWGRTTVNKDFRTPDPGEFFIPHALALAEDKNLVFVADRENGRVQCFNANTGNFSFIVSSKAIGHRIFSVAYSSVDGGAIYVVNGVDFGQNVPVQGFKLSMKGELLGSFGPLTNPHDIAISNNGKNVYVVEISPFKAWKFVLNNCTSQTKSESSKMTTSQPLPVKQEAVYTIPASEKGLTGALMVTGACILFSAAIVISAFKYSRSRESGSADWDSLIQNADI